MWKVALPASVFAMTALLLGVSASPTRAAYRRLTAASVGATASGRGGFTEADLEPLPPPVQRYFRYGGYLGTPKAAVLTMRMERVEFVADQGRVLVIDYEQVNRTDRPERFALITSSVLGVPFEGLDSYDGNAGRMRGILAKVVPLFDQTGDGMDRSCLVTWLAESLLAPNGALQEFVQWEAIDDTRARATITWQGTSAGGVFVFAGTGELQSFRTSDRVAVGMDGQEVKADWSAYFEDYRSSGGVRRVGVMRAAWHVEGGDVVYFNRNGSTVEIGSASEGE